MNFHELDNFNLADAVKFHRRLNPRIWGLDEHLLPEVREKLLAIAADFQEFLGVDDLKVQDITISGSNAAYSYTPHSDIDLHLVVDMPDDPVYQELFNAKKYQYNDEHDIRIGGVPVELYVQSADQKHISQGIYSIKNGEWTQVPQRRRARIDDSCVQHKAADLDARIHAAIRSQNADAIDRLWDKIKTMRQTGLEQNGEFGCENITFKLLRNKGCIGQLKAAKTAQRDRELSLAPKKPRERKKVNYGMRDYWYPGTAYAGQDHPAGTESEQIDEAWQQGVLGLGSSGPEVAELQAKLGVDPDGKFGPATRQAVIALQKKLGVTPDGAYGPITRAADEKSQNGKTTPSKDIQPVTSVSTSATPAANKPRVVVVGDSIAVGIAQAAGLPSDAVVGRSTRAILSAAASNPAVQGADVAIVSSGTNDYPLANGGRNNNPEATINNISRTRDALKAKQYVWILPFNRNAAEDVKKAIGNDAYVDLADVATTRDQLHPTNYKAVATAALSKFAKPGIMESVDPDHLKKILHRFYKSCVDKLQLKNPPQLRLETTPEWSKENGSFGQYDSDTNTLILATSGRHVLDILRTMAHEMTHRHQDEQSPLPADAGETGSPWEDQANAMAGRIMRQWAEEQPEMFDGVTLEESAHAHLSVPPVLYHATYRPLLRSIKRGGLGGPGSEKKKWEDSIHGAVYLALDPHVAESYAETSDSVPDDWLDEIVILQISTAGLNPSKFMLDRNVRDNAGDTVEYHGIIPLSNISVLKKNMSEASGYIPTKKQARDPRFVMALTRDVRPGAVGKEANKLGLQTDSQGHPALLTAGLQKMLREFKEQDLFEIRMSPTNLKQLAAKTGALAGMEFEMIVPNTQGGDDYDQEPDYDMDERASSPQDIRDFFHDGDYNGRRDVDRLIDSMIEDFSDWQSEAFDNRWESDSEQFIYDYIRENMDDDDVRGLLSLEPDDDITKKEYQLAADKIVADQLEPWYEDAQESAREEFYDDDDLFEEWLADSGLTHMSDIESRYNITWPYYRSVSSGEGASVQETAESFSQAVGRPARASDSYHAYGVERPEPGKNFYVVEPDSSISPDDPDDAGLEFVSPPLPIDQMISDLNKVKKWADLNGCYTNDSTGLHINISVPDYSQNKLDFVKLALLMGDEYVLDQFGRASNTYARSAMGKVRDHVQKRPYEAKYLLDKMKGHMGELASKAIHSGSTEKYTSINTKNGHVEFRSPGGDWLGDNFDKIENTLLRFTVALSAAMDPAAYREEYLKKLYKILAPKDEKDPLAVFAKYAAGELPKQALKSFVRQAQTERQVKKSGEAIVNGHRWSVRLKPELGGGEVEVIAADPIDAKKEAIKQQPNWRFVDDSALTITRLDEPTASTTTSPSQSRGRPNDPNGRYAITRRDDRRNYGNRVGSEAPYYLFRFTLPDGYTSAQMNAVLQAWAARKSVNPDDYMIVDTTQFAAPAQTTAPEPSNMRWNIINSRNEIVHSFWNRNVQADANAVAREWFYNNNMANSPDGPFEVVPAAIPGSTLDLQRQRQAAAAAPTPIAGVQDIEPDVEQYTSQPAQTQWEVYDRSTGNPVFRMYAANQQEAWRKGQEWVANYARMTPDQAIDPADYSVRQSAEPVSESISVLEQRLRRELDALGNQPVTGPETPPKMPDGTIKVDVSDMYDWYKLGQHISDLSSIDKSTLGKGPPNTVFAFGSEDLENKYSHELTNLGLKTHDLDEPGEEDVDEAFDRPYKTKTEKSEYGDIDMVARLPDGTYLSIMFNNQGNDEWQVEFYRNNSQEVTGEGDAQRIFATVLNAIQKFVKKHKPLQITFSASKEVEPGQNSESRAKLYNRLVDRYAAALGYHARTIEHTNAVSYELTRYSDQAPFEENFVKQDVGESQEITKLNRLDSVLEKCIDLIHRGQETDPDKYGRVAACLIDNKNNHTYALNLPGPNHTRRHAERVAIDLHLKRHGRIGPDAVMVTTLSPCVKHMSERYGESCTDLLSDYGIKQCYAGWEDPTQQPAEDYPFNLKVTDNADIFNTCKDIAASFLPQAMAESQELDEKVNPRVIEPGFTAEKKLGNRYVMKAQARYTGDPGDDLRGLIIKLYDTQASSILADWGIGQVRFVARQDPKTKDWYLVSSTTHVDDRYQRQGLASAMYNWARELGNDIEPSSARTKMGRHFWDKGAGVGREFVPPVEEPAAEPVSKPTRPQSLKDRLFKMFTEEYSMAEVYDGPQMKFLKPGELSGSYSPQQMQSMGFKQSSNGAWYIPVSTWQKLVSGGQIRENFADGRNPQDKGDSKRHGVPTKSSVSNLRRFAKSHSGRAAQLAHWMANMKAGRAKKKKTNEDTVATINLGDITVNLDDHALTRQRQRGINDNAFDAAIRRLKLPRVINQMSQLEVGNRFYVLDHTTNVALGLRKIGNAKYVLKTVLLGRPADYNITDIITV